MDEKPSFEEILKELDNLKVTDPEGYLKTMSILQEMAQAGNEEKTDNLSSNQELDSLSMIKDSVQKLRDGKLNESDLNRIVLSKDNKQPKGITITPNPGFSFKTKRLNKDNMKVFINICEHDEIDSPGIKKKLNEEGEEIEGMNIPMSVGQPRNDVDKSGVSCIIYDIIVNPTVITESSNDKTGKYKDFICQLGIQSIEQKYKEELDKKYKLPKLKYMGKIENQTIKDRKQIPKIEEISSNTNKTSEKSIKQSASPLIVEIEQDLGYSVHWLHQKNYHTQVNNNNNELINQTKNMFSKISANQLVETYDWISFTHPTNEYIEPIKMIDHNITKAIMISCEIKANDIKSSENIQMNISPYKINIKIKGYKKISLYFPCVIQPSLSYSILDRHNNKSFISKVYLRIILVLDDREWESVVDPGSKPWLVTQALSTDDSTYNPYDLEIISNNNNNDNNSNNNNNNNMLPEDKFHLSLPDDVDKYTGLKLDNNGIETDFDPLPKLKVSNEYAEDRFHQKDASSSFFINQREQAIKDKWDKYEKEKSERVNDPN
eukprot:gene16231-22090_t